MNSQLDHDVSRALQDVFDRLSVPQADVARILNRSSRRRATRRITGGFRLGALLATAAAVVVVMIAGTQRGWASDIAKHQPLSVLIAQAFKMLHLPLPKNATNPTLHVENLQYADESRIQAALPFRPIEPSGLPEHYGATIHGETRRTGNIGIYWMMTPSPLAFYGESIEVDEFAHGHAVGIPSSSPDKTVSLEFKPDGSLKRAYVVVLNERAVRRFTIRNVDVAVIVTERNPGQIADAIRKSMLAEAKETGELEK
jgi:hypothetical protein